MSDSVGSRTGPGASPSSEKRPKSGEDIIALLGYATDLAAANERLRTVINEAVAFMDRRHHYADAPMIASLRAVLRGEVRRLDQGEPSALPAPNYLGRGA